MITCSTIGYNGRLANQMFQFASTIGIARNLGYDPKFPLENFVQGNPHDYNGGKLRECFDIPDEYFSPRVAILRNIFYEYNENSFSYNEETGRIPDGVNLNGYFQTERYFKHAEKEIRGVFKFKDAIIQKSLEVIMIGENSTAVHVRRGDYVNSLNHHPVQSADYYLNSMEKIGDSTFYFFSDDIEWCKKNLNFPEKRIVYLDVEDPYVSLNLMSQCTNHIISNSSFSWWAAWLGKNDSQSVFSPLVWFGPSLSHNSPEDLYCHGWNKI